MQARNGSSFFRDLKTRELNGFPVRKRPFLRDLSSESGVLRIEHEGNTSPPLAISFSKTSRNLDLLAVSDEDGYVSLYNTWRNLNSSACFRDRVGASEEARVCDWVAHHNAIFDLCWIKDDTHILTASGDQTIKIWNAEKNSCVGIMKGHSGSVKSLCSHPTSPDLVVSGSRDGSFALWDLRCNPNSQNSRGEACLFSTTTVKDAHPSMQRKRTRRGKAASMSITSVLYLKDEVSIASAGAVDSVVKLWDTRNLKSSIIQTCPHFESSSGKEHTLHGISCLSQDSNGVFLAASCMDNNIYLYDVLHLDKGPTKTFSGSKIGTFYVKSAISPDAAHILGGSSDGNSYIWQVGKPEVGPVMLKGHEGEVTAVDWCLSEFGKIATSSDDFTVRVWNIRNGSCINTASPSSIRRRITAIPGMQCRKLFMDEPSIGPRKAINDLHPSEETSDDPHSPIHMKSSEFNTPESMKNRKSFSISLNGEPEMQKSPEANFNSPSSVLNPPPSLKRRTIRDYFVAAS